MKESKERIKATVIKSHKLTRKILITHKEPNKFAILCLHIFKIKVRIKRNKDTLINIGNMKNIRNQKNMRNMKDMKDMKDIRNMTNMANMKNMKSMKNIRRIIEIKLLLMP